MAQPDIDTDTEADDRTDLSNHSWDDLIDADYDVVQSLAGEYDEIDGRWSQEKIAAFLLALNGRFSEAPDDVRAEYEAEILDVVSDEDPDHADQNGDTEGESAGDTDDETTEDEPDEYDVDVVDEDDEPEDEDADVDKTQTGTLGNSGSNVPRTSASFIIPVDPLRAWLDHLGALVDEARIHLNHDGWSTTAVDPANVGMVNARIDSLAFEHYDVPEPGMIGVNTDRLEDVLSGANKGDLANIEYNAERRNLVISYGGHEWTLSLIDPDSIRQEPDLPDLDLAAQVEIGGGDFKDAVKYSEQVTDHIRFEVDVGIDPTDPRVFILRGEGDVDVYEGRFEDGDEGVSITASEQAVSLYSLDYVTDMVKTFDRDLTITVHLGNEFPTLMAAEIQDAEGERCGDVEYMLAPRIQSD